MKYHAVLLLFLFDAAGSFAHEHEADAAKSLDAWASVPVITHWGNAAVYVHAFFMSLATLVLLPAGTPISMILTVLFSFPASVCLCVSGCNLAAQE